VLSRWNVLTLLVVFGFAGLYVFVYFEAPFQVVSVCNGSIYFSARFHGSPNLSFSVGMSDLGLPSNLSQYRLIADGIPMDSSFDPPRYAYLWTFTPDRSSGLLNITFYPVSPEVLQSDFFLCRRLDMHIRVAG